MGWARSGQASRCSDLGSKQQVELESPVLPCSRFDIRERRAPHRTYSIGQLGISFNRLWLGATEPRRSAWRTTKMLQQGSITRDSFLQEPFVYFLRLCDRRQSDTNCLGTETVDEGEVSATAGRWGRREVPIQLARTGLTASAGSEGRVTAQAGSSAPCPSEVSPARQGQR